MQYPNIMHVVFVVTALGTGGAELMLLKLVNAMQKSRFCISVIALGESTPLAEELKGAGVVVTTLDAKGLWKSARGLITLLRVLSASKPKVIQGWMVHGNLVEQIAGSILRVPVFWGVRHARLVAGK